MSDEPSSESAHLSTPGVISISNDDVGVRLDQFIARELGSLSRGQVKKLIDSKSISVNQKSVKASYRLRLNDQVTIKSIITEQTEKSTKKVQPSKVEVLFEDEHLAAVNKPAGMITHPAKGFWAGTLTEVLKYQFDSLSDIGGSTRPGIVHRLDRDTSGVILIAKTNETHELLVKQFKDRTIEKEYAAIVSGVPDRDRDMISEPIGAHPKIRERMAIRRNDPDAKPAQTFYEVAERLKGYSLIRAFPKTGRTHQIRLHLTHAQFPIICDRQYAGHASITRGELLNNKESEVVLERMALHAKRLKLNHPISNEELEIECPLANDIQTVVDLLKSVNET